MRDRLMDPVSFLSRSRLNVQAPYDYPVSLFLNKDSDEFLHPMDRVPDGPLTPDQFIANLLQKRIHQSATSIWQNKESIMISQPLRKTVRRRTTLALGMLFGFSLIWIMMFGTSAISIWALVIIALPYVVTTTVLLKRLVDRSYKSSGALQAQQVFEQIQFSVDERLNRLKDHITKELNPEELWDEVFHLLKANQTEPNGHLSFL